MKKLLSILLMVCLCLSFGIMVVGCDQSQAPQQDDNGMAVYTVTEEQWKINFSLTKNQVQTQSSCIGKEPTLSTFSAPALTEITSYTLFAEGSNEGISGTSLLKVSPSAMSIEFYVGNTLKESESGVFASDTDFYKGLTTSIMAYFPFENNYSNFTFDQTKKAYVGEDLTSVLNDEYDVNKHYEMYTKSAEVSFINGYLNTITVELCDKTFTNVYASYVFTFTDINNTIVG